MKSLLVAALAVLGFCGVASATDCHQNAVVQRVVAHDVYVQPVRQVQFVEVVDNHHAVQQQRVVVQKVQVKANVHAAQNVVKVEKVVNRRGGLFGNRNVEVRVERSRVR